MRGVTEVGVRGRPGHGDQVRNGAQLAFGEDSWAPFLTFAAYPTSGSG